MSPPKVADIHVGDPLRGLFRSPPAPSLMQSGEPRQEHLQTSTRVGDASPRVVRARGVHRVWFDRLTTNGGRGLRGEQELENRIEAWLTLLLLPSGDCGSGGGRTMRPAKPGSDRSPILFDRTWMSCRKARPTVANLAQRGADALQSPEGNSKSVLRAREVHEQWLDRRTAHSFRDSVPWMPRTDSAGEKRVRAGTSALQQRLLASQA
jgi:hypothetical protein